MSPFPLVVFLLSIQEHVFSFVSLAQSVLSPSMPTNKSQGVLWQINNIGPLNNLVVTYLQSSFPSFDVGKPAGCKFAVVGEAEVDLAEAGGQASVSPKIKQPYISLCSHLSKPINGFWALLSSCYQVLRAK